MNELEFGSTYNLEIDWHEGQINIDVDWSFTGKSWDFDVFIIEIRTSEGKVIPKESFKNDAIVKIKEAIFFMEDCT